ncbi:hypothetical protein SLEP1_g22894 [Rubroshorea leprosula]|uniref:Uncharacterized protein n=1 Tax=Rubroshorea leprosula TaxID=152421 RepID=A0AAV5JJU3_9ROSI|nr:hypothetical protein SLEP1_g22894 [Rubroshorea leprosula]
MFCSIGRITEYEPVLSVTCRHVLAFINLPVTPQNPSSRRDRRRALVNGSHECTRFGTY